MNPLKRIAAAPARRTPAFRPAVEVAEARLCLSSSPALWGVAPGAHPQGAVALMSSSTSDLMNILLGLQKASAAQEHADQAQAKDALEDGKGGGSAAAAQAAVEFAEQQLMRSALVLATSPAASAN